jgi:hypothetical protein
MANSTDPATGSGAAAEDTLAEELQRSGFKPGRRTGITVQQGRKRETLTVRNSEHHQHSPDDLG